ncbi:MAG: beta-galactosidase [Candidatus Lindowbacteria bacterium]|nr:beta-galactosidase [Candidatus Lindowbacteria bacterium]
MLHKLAVQFGLMLLLVSIVALDCQAVESKRIGLNAGPKAFGESIKYTGDLGIGSMRVVVQWQLVEPSPGQFDWTTTDRIVDTAQAKNVEVLFTLRSISSWGTKQETQQRSIYRSGSAPSDMKQWTQFLEALAGRYKGRGVHYEIENEVNGPTFWSGTVEEYVELLKASYPVIKQADPDARVLPSAMACKIVRNFKPGRNEEWNRHDEWLRAILSTKSFDAVSVHNYYFPSEIVANGLTFRGYLDHIRDLMKEAGVSERPIWITEAGYVSRTTDASGRKDKGTPEKQAKWLKEAYQQAFESGVERVFWLLLRDREEAYFGSMGLADANGKPRPAWNAMKQLTKSPQP